MSSRRGVCRYCRCTENHACVLSMGQLMSTLNSVRKLKNVALARVKEGKTHFTCSWINSRENVCSNPHCVRKHRVHEREKRRRQIVRLRHGRQIHARRAA
ncbi:MAG TPA: hypothetical protein VHA06_06970 [Candidatus Angelobacter sp.]|nr:hypothetical protein [Candidatus Angelobacter sp.]